MTTFPTLNLPHWHNDLHPLPFLDVGLSGAVRDRPSPGNVIPERQRDPIAVAKLSPAAIGYFGQCMYLGEMVKLTHRH